MSESKRPAVGTISWRDLTVENAEEVRDFYGSVVGWDWKPLGMGDHDDFCMNLPGTEDTVAGICHARGGNADLPAQWLVYIEVEDVDASAATAKEKGGAVLAGPKDMGGGRFCVIRDPAGAVCALYRSPSGPGDAPR